MIDQARFFIAFVISLTMSVLSAIGSIPTDNMVLQNGHCIETPSHSARPNDCLIETASSATWAMAFSHLGHLPVCIILSFPSRGVLAV